MHQVTAPTSRLPEKLNLGQESNSTLRYLYLNLKTHNEQVENGEALDTVEADRYVCGMPLPPFQRPQKWTLEQQVSFVESVVYGIPLGTYSFVNIAWSDGKVNPMAGWVLDGQQRLTALESFFNDEFAVFGLKFSDLNQIERNKILHTKFSAHVISVETEQEARMIYDLMAFGGVQHEEHERALPKK